MLLVLTSLAAVLYNFQSVNMTTQLYVVGNKYTVFCGQTPIFSKQVGILMLRIFCVSSQLIAGEDE